MCKQQLDHLAIRASAGTGKTFQLSNRYLRLLHAGEEPQRILATTFSRKAAGEILDRVLNRLAEAALDEQACQKLAEELDADGLDTSRAMELLGSMVRRLHRLNICTLDALFVQIAKSFSFSLGLPTPWTIMEPTADAQLRAEAIRAMLNENQPQTLVTLMRHLSKGESKRSITGQIDEVARDLHGVYLESPAEAWRAVPRREGTLSSSELACAVERMRQMDLPRTKTGKPHGTWVNALNTASDAARTGDWEGFIKGGLLQAVATGGDTFANKPVEPDHVAVLSPLIHHASAVLVNRIVDQTRATWDVIQRFDDEYFRLRRQRRVLRFEDVTRMLAGASLLGKLDEAYYRLDARLHHLLLDEFQDTSAIQWQVILPLAEEITSHADVERTFLCVGDRKQAIYGWRGGESEILTKVEHQLAGVRTPTLTTSYRSSEPVIRTINRVFGDIAQNPALANYAASAQRWAQGFQAHTTAREHLPGYVALEAAGRAEDGQDQKLRTLVDAATRVKQIVDQSPGCSVGVLMRRNEQIARWIHELGRMGVPASEEGGNPLTDSPAVCVVLSLLTMADHPGDTVARFHVKHSPLGRVVGFERYEDDQAAHRVGARMRRSLMREGYARVLEGLAGDLAAWCDQRDMTRLMQLVELARRYEPEATVRPGDFVRFVESQKVEDPSGADVRVMTVHQAKGLGFDVVVLPELDEPLLGQTPRLMTDKPDPISPPTQVSRYANAQIRGLAPELEQMYEQYERETIREALSVLYVAMTRAKQALHMMIAPPSPNQRNLPATFAGVLRGALQPELQVEPNQLLYQHGEARWYEGHAVSRGTEGWSTGARVGAPSPLSASPTGADTQEDRELQMPRPTLAKPGRRRRRGLTRRSPSTLAAEGEEGAVDLAQRLVLDGSEARAFGVAIHALFEEVGFLDQQVPDRADLLRRLERAEVNPQHAREWIDQFYEMLENDEVREALSRRGVASDEPGVASSKPRPAAPQFLLYREHPFAVREADAVITGRIDRMVVEYDDQGPIAVQVIDFKTDAVDGEATQERLDRLTEHYRPQMRAYRKAATEMTGVDPQQVTAKLVFACAGVVREV